MEAEHVLWANAPSNIIPHPRTHAPTSHRSGRYKLSIYAPRPSTFAHPFLNREFTHQHTSLRASSQYSHSLTRLSSHVASMQAAQALLLQNLLVDPLHPRIRPPTSHRVKRRPVYLPNLSGRPYAHSNCPLTPLRCAVVGSARLEPAASCGRLAACASSLPPPYSHYCGCTHASARRLSALRRPRVVVHLLIQFIHSLRCMAQSQTVQVWSPLALRYVLRHRPLTPSTSFTRQLALRSRRWRSVWSLQRATVAARALSCRQCDLGVRRVQRLRLKRIATGYAYFETHRGRVPLRSR